MPFENKLVVIDPSGQIVMSYLKSHAVAGWEAGIMRLGGGLVPVVPTRDGRIAGAICFDADFPEFIRQAAEGNADLLIVPVNDWKEVKDMHLQMHAFRAIETGIPLLRAAASGISTAFDPWGRVLGLADYFAAGDRTMTAQIAVGGVRTIYARTGDLFAWLCVAGLVIAVGATERLGLGRDTPARQEARQIALHSRDVVDRTDVSNEAQQVGHGEVSRRLRRQLRSPLLALERQK